MTICVCLIIKGSFILYLKNMFSQSPYISNGFIRKTQFYVEKRLVMIIHVFYSLNLAGKVKKQILCLTSYFTSATNKMLCFPHMHCTSILCHCWGLQGSVCFYCMLMILVKPHSWGERGRGVAAGERERWRGLRRAAPGERLAKLAPVYWWRSPFKSSSVLDPQRGDARESSWEKLQTRRTRCDWTLWVALLCVECV